MVHKYRLNGCNFALDVNSGAVHVLDDLAYEMLDFANKDEAIEKFENAYSKEEVLQCFEELQQLRDNGQLFSKDNYENFINARENTPIKSLCLNVAHDCNLKCEYCFAAKGDFGQGRMLMPFDVGKRAIDFLIQNSGERRNLEVDFFGGEPLMNFEVVKQIVRYARALEQKHNKNFRFTITTNGLLLDSSKIDFINKEMANVVLSIDGRKSINDKLRITNNGKGTYNTILPKFQELVLKRKSKDYYVRGTFTTNNLDFTKDVLHLASLGFEQISVEPVVSDQKLPYSISEKNLPQIFEEYEKLAKVLLKNPNINFFHFMVDLNQGPCAIKRLRGCGCGNEYIAITPEGDIYPCHQFVGENRWKMGNVIDNTFTQSIKDVFAKTHIYSKEGCRDCWAKFYCSGGCSANGWQYEGDIFKPHKISCELQKKRLECAIMLQALKED